MLERNSDTWRLYDVKTTTVPSKTLLFVFCLLNRSQRLLFDVSSPNGILLFRETSKMITTYGTES